MISLQEAKQLVLQQAHSFGKEIVSLEDALGRTIAQTIIADRDYPPFNRATMDGIAIHSADFEKGIRSFAVAETIYAGAIATQSIKSGECFKIMTGAAVPPSANAVIRREDITEEGNRLSITVSKVKPFQNIALKGQDIQQQTAVIDTNILCTAGTVMTLASLGYHEAAVMRLPKVSILTTGDEVVNITEQVNEVQIRNSNVHLLKALLEKWKISSVNTMHVKDNAELLLTAINQYKQQDILILSGAVSAGDADFVPEVLVKAGAKKIFHKVAIRPGKPIWFGQFENGATVFALPGNPFSTLATFKLFIESFLYKCFELTMPDGLAIAISENRNKKNNLDEFFPVTISGNPSSAKPLYFNTSGDITAALHADALALHPADKPDLVKGDIVDCIVL